MSGTFRAVTRSPLPGLLRPAHLQLTASVVRESHWRTAWRPRRRCRAFVAAAAAASAGGSSSSEPITAGSDTPAAPQPNCVLFISSVWPERSSSAAGVRTCDLLDAFRARGWAAAFASSSTPNEHTAALAGAGVATHVCPPNREAALREVLAAARPSVVVLDRFYSEEAFSFRVRDLAPHALRVLDMQDFHALRAARQRAAEAGEPPGAVLGARPGADRPELLRELAAIHRSDLTLVCSPAELELLCTRYGVPRAKLALAPFFAPSSPHATPGAAPGFDERRHFLMIGNWRHPPNLDSARWAAQLWPALRKALPPQHRDAELHLYGAYPAGAAQQLHKPAAGVRMLGFAPSLDLMLRYRLLLAPLRYGAGLKGKVVDAWWHGLPVVTTPVGAEGMHAADAAPEDLAAAGLTAAAATAAPDSAAEGYVWQLGGAKQQAAGADPGGNEWGGLCGATSADGVIAAAALLYSEPGVWAAAQRRGFDLLGLLYDRERNLGRVLAAVEAARGQLEQRRAADVTGAMLWMQQLRATEYFSRFIELKEGLRAAAGQSS